MTLDKEQLEAILSGEIEPPAEMDPSDEAKLAEMQALRDRLRAAFGSVRSGELLAERVRGRLREASPGAEVSQPPAVHKRALRLPFPVPWLVGAAAVIVIAVGIVFLLPTPPAAAQPQLTEIHLKNVGGEPGDHEFHHMSDPNAIASHMAEELGFPPVVPHLEEGSSMLGCCTRRFFGKNVGTYIAGLPEGKVSVVITRDPPETLKFGRRFERDGITFHACKHKPCNMVAFRLGEHTYCAVGRVSHDTLTGLLLKLRSELRPQPGH